MTDNTSKFCEQGERHLSEQAAVARRVAVAALDESLLSEIRHSKKAGKTRSGDGQQDPGRKALY